MVAYYPPRSICASPTMISRSGSAELKGGLPVIRERSRPARMETSTTTGCSLSSRLECLVDLAKHPNRWQKGIGVGLLLGPEFSPIPLEVKSMGVTDRERGLRVSELAMLPVPTLHFDPRSEET